MPKAVARATRNPLSLPAAKAAVKAVLVKKTFKKCIKKTPPVRKESKTAAPKVASKK